MSTYMSWASTDSGCRATISDPDGTVIVNLDAARRHDEVHHYLVQVHGTHKGDKVAGLLRYGQSDESFRWCSRLLAGEDVASVVREMTYQAHRR